MSKVYNLIEILPTIPNNLIIQLSALYYSSCLGVQCHVYYYYLYWMHCDTQHSSLGSLVFAHLGGIIERT